MALVKAAKEAGVKRFSPSEWAGSGDMPDEVQLSGPKTEVWDAIKDSGMEYTRFANGLFLYVLAT